MRAKAAGLCHEVGYGRRAVFGLVGVACLGKIKFNMGIEHFGSMDSLGTGTQLLGGWAPDDRDALDA